MPFTTPFMDLVNCNTKTTHTGEARETGGSWYDYRNVMELCSLQAHVATYPVHADCCLNSRCDGIDA